MSGLTKAFLLLTKETVDKRKTRRFPFWPWCDVCVVICEPFFCVVKSSAWWKEKKHTKWQNNWKRSFIASQTLYRNKKQTKQPHVKISERKRNWNHLFDMTNWTNICIVCIPKSEHLQYIRLFAVCPPGPFVQITKRAAKHERNFDKLIP
jgi:hypothetical protein